MSGNRAGWRHLPYAPGRAVGSFALPIALLQATLASAGMTRSAAQGAVWLTRH
jgi:hypothetical protein